MPAGARARCRADARRWPMRRRSRSLSSRSAGCGWRRVGWSRPTSSRTRVGANRAVCRRRHSPTAAPSVAKPTHRWSRPPVNSRITSVVPFAPSSPAKTSSGSDQNGRRSRRARSPTGGVVLVARRESRYRPDVPVSLRGSGRRRPLGVGHDSLADRVRAVRGAGWAELTILVEAAIDAAGWDRATLVGADERSRAVLLDAIAVAPSGARAGARVQTERPRVW